MVNLVFLTGKITYRIGTKLVVTKIFVRSQLKMNLLTSTILYAKFRKADMHRRTTHQSNGVSGGAETIV